MPALVTPSALGSPRDDPRRRTLLLKAPHALNRGTRYLPNPPSRKIPLRAAKNPSFLAPKYIKGKGQTPRGKSPGAGRSWLRHRRHPSQSPTSSPRLRVTSQSKLRTLGTCFHALLTRTHPPAAERHLHSRAHFASRILKHPNTVSLG